MNLGLQMWLREDLETTENGIYGKLICLTHNYLAIRELQILEWVRVQERI